MADVADGQQRPSPRTQLQETRSLSGGLVLLQSSRKEQKAPLETPEARLLQFGHEVALLADRYIYQYS